MTGAGIIPRSGPGTLEPSFAERRVLGALIDKGFTTPEQYPLSLNAVVVASNQKSCRDPDREPH